MIRHLRYPALCLFVDNRELHLETVIDSMDPVGIAGLALTVFDQLLKLGDRTIETIQDLKTFEEVTPLTSR